MTTLLAHEWLAPTGGSENVFEEMCASFPEADSVCLWNDATDRFPSVSETFLARTPLRRHKPLALPLMSAAWGQVSLQGVDRVLVSSHAFAHHLATRASKEGIPAFAYVHTPARYIWNPELDQRGEHWAGRLSRQPFRFIDRRRTSNEVRYAANSEFVAQRIRSAWNVDSRVIPPPVDVHTISSAVFAAADPTEQSLVDRLPNEFVLGASRLVPYKRLDSAIDVGELLHLPVVIAGSGPDAERLRDRANAASVPVLLTGRISTPLLWELYRRSSLYVFTAVEDFGIMPVEAMAAGTPVLANRVGGAKETVLATGGGSVADPDDVAELAAAAARAIDVDMSVVNPRLDGYSVERFRARLQTWAGGAAERERHVESSR